MNAVTNLQPARPLDFASVPNIEDLIQHYCNTFQYATDIYQKKIQVYEHRVHASQLPMFLRLTLSDLKHHNSSLLTNQLVLISSSRFVVGRNNSS